MTDFDLFGDHSKHLDEDQATGPKSPVPYIITHNEEETLHNSTPSLQKDSHVLSPLLNQFETPKDVSSILHVQEGTSEAKQ